jgi:hypothetical protein
MHTTNTYETFLRPDSKGRITLGKMAEGVSGYKTIYDKTTHRVILEPYIEIPLQEKWLYENKEAIKRVRKGLQESSEGNLQDLGNFSKFIEEE